MPEKYKIAPILTRRQPSSVAKIPGAEKITGHLGEFLDNCDLVVECSGTVNGARRVIEGSLKQAIPTVSLNAEFQMTLGAAFRGSGLLTEAQGDQPGSLAALDEEVRLMGFQPVVYGSQKGFLDHAPSPTDMKYWAEKQGISLSAVTSFADGTKVQIEQALVADFLGAGITRQGLSGPKAASLREGAQALGEIAKSLDFPIADYTLSPGGRGEIFIVAKHPLPPEQLKYYKMGDGDLYYIERPYHLGHLEIPVTIDRVVQGRGPLMVAPERPMHSVLALAKKDLAKGTKITRAIGSFDFRGEAVRIADAPDHVPIGLLENCVLKENMSKHQAVTWSDVAFSTMGSVDLWRSIHAETVAPLTLTGF